MSIPDDDREIADASFLFDDQTGRRPSPERPGQRREPDGEPPPEPDGEPPPDVGGYDLADHGPRRPKSREAAPPTSSVLPTIERPGAVEPKSRQLTPAPVDPPWTRLAEWGPALVRIGVVGAATVVLAYLAFSADRLLLTLAIFAIGGVLMVLLSYPIAITLERPVRMTPEHAIRDFYGALSHHVPHHRRMWLLLSSAGRSAPEFDSYADFRSYWITRLAELKGGKGWMMSPVSIRIEQFEADKSVGQEVIEASYTLSIFLRDREGDGPLASTQAETTLSRGPDRMWYLDDGTLPGR